MRQVLAPDSMQRLTMRWRREGVRVALVPTMGYLHEGHLSLVKRARAAVGGSGRVVVSIYVNPTQFAPTEDLASYPRDLRRDLTLCREAGVDVAFTPTDAAMYPRSSSGGWGTHVIEDQLSRRMEGASRPTHFRGVATVVAKLFNLVQPNLAVFGAKDWQQVAVVRRMTADLDFPVKILVAPTRREADGLAMSSRNAKLTPAQRVQAVALWNAIQQARGRIEKAPKGRAQLSADSLRAELKALIEKEPEARVDYIEFFDPDTLEPVPVVTRSTRMALAVWVGTTRLIDNAALDRSARI